MNRSGEAVGELMRFYKVSSRDLILIYDDLDLNTGQLRIKEKGGSGGHKGCASVISSIGTDDFLRVRLGIGRPAPGNDIVGYVLSEFKRDELPVIETAIENAAEAVRLAIDNNIFMAMNKFNH